MSIKRRQLFVGVLDKEKWTNEKLCAYLIKHACTNDDQYITDCQIMSYTEKRFQDKSFAFITFTDEICVDNCMKKRQQFNDEYGMTMKRLLPDSTSKCERLTSTPDIVIRLFKFDELFTDENIRLYFNKYGKIIDLKMLEEENTGGICLITFEDFDSTDRILIDSPHYLNKQILSIHKYTPPEYICSLSQFRFIDKNRSHEIKRWYPFVRNLTDLIHPLTILYKTQLALIKYNNNKQILISKSNLNKIRENLVEYENRHNSIKQDYLNLLNIQQQLNKQIQDNQIKNEKCKNSCEKLIQQQKEKNQSLQEAILHLQENF